MRYGAPFALVCLAAGSAEVRAQEVLPLPPPDPLPAKAAGPTQTPPPGSPAPVPLSPVPSPGAQNPLYPYPAPYGLPPGGGYGPPPGAVFRPPVLVGDPAGNPNLWLDLESIVWWSKNQPLPVPAVTTGPASQGANAGGLGVSGTASLDRPLQYATGAGIRLTLGGWVTPDHVWGLEGSVFDLGRQTAGFGASDHSGAGNLVLNEPVAGAPFVTQVSAPGVETGGVSVDSTTEFWGADVNGLFNLVRRGPWTVSLSGGFRYLQLTETLDLVANSGLFVNTTYTDNLGNTLATAPPGSGVTVVDQFGARNQFYGGQAGVRFQYLADRWSVNGAATLALGSTHETVTVNGTTTVYPVNGPPVTLAGGNYATLQAGGYTANRFAAAPGVQLNLGYQLTPFLRATVGYNFLYISSVARPGNQIDNAYDGATHPVVPMTNSSFWSQGMTFGLRVSF